MLPNNSRNNPSRTHGVRDELAGRRCLNTEISMPVMIIGSSCTKWSTQIDHLSYIPISVALWAYMSAGDVILHVS